jgi:alpha-1,3-mannosyl-glycoprotein beta-1,2-N-acetylglucosaminyltransferase
MAIRTGKRTKKSSVSRRSVEKRAICALMVMAWAWILGFLGVVLWHLRKRNNVSSEEGVAAGGSRGDQSFFGSLTTSKQQKKDDAPQSNDKKDNAMTPSEVVLPAGGNYESPIVIFTCQRAQYLSDTLTDLLNNIPKPCRFGCPIIISEDGTHADVDLVVATFQKKFQAIGVPLFHIHHQQGQHLRGSNGAYRALAQHYGWALSQIFNGRIDPRLPEAQRVVILEEDIHTASDFFSYMEATSQLLDNDPTLFAVSAFNDNGHLVQDAKRLLRSDFFPGLGWMMTRKLWTTELERKWPESYWDDWLREPDQRRDRQIIRPEYSRTYHFGKQGGASKNQFGSILEKVKLSTEHVDWSQEDLSYLAEGAYNDQYSQLILASTKVSSVQEAEEALASGNARLEYRNFEHFQEFAHQLNIMDDEKAMVPRTGYKGVVESRPFGNNLLFLTPQAEEMRVAFPGISSRS